MKLADVPAAVHKAEKARAERHAELVEVMRALLTPGDEVRWATLRRALTLAGHRGDRAHELAMALAEAFPDVDVRLARSAPRGRGPRIVRGVTMAVDLDQLRQAVQRRWQILALPPQRRAKAEEERTDSAAAKAAAKAVADKWEAQLAAEGMGADLVDSDPTPTEFKIGPEGDPNGTRLDDLVRTVHARHARAAYVFDVATDYLWATGWSHHKPGDRAIWVLYCEGASLQQIAEETGRPRTTVQKRLNYHRARAGLVNR